MNLKIFNLNRIKFTEMYKDAMQYISNEYNQSGQVFSTASPYGQLLQVILNMGRLIFYYIEDSITELNISTATRKNSIYAISRLTGHNPTRAIAATGTVKISYKEDIDMHGNSLIIPNHSTIRSENNNLPYILFLPSKDARLTMTPRSYIYANIKQGEMEAQKYTATGKKLQSYTVLPKKGKEIDMHEIKIYVNNKEWPVYDSLYDMSYKTKGVIIKTGLTEGIDIFFGNRYFGEVPEYGEEIRVEYLVTAGENGNMTQSNSNSWSFESECYDILGEEVDVNTAVTISTETNISYGSNSEPLYLTKLIAPHTSRNFVLANPVNYEYFLEKFNYFSYIDAYTTFNDDNVYDDNIIYLFLIPDINKRKRNSDDYFTIPYENFLLTEDEKEKLYKVIEESGQKVLTAVNKIIDPILKRYALNISLSYFENFNKDLIREQIISKMSDYFLANQRRDKIPKSDLIAIIENIEGVDSVNVWFVGEENEQSKANNPNNNDIGIDEFGDIIIQRNELPLIRGGWYDRNNIYINDHYDKERPSSINILFEHVTKKTYNSDKHQSNLKNIK